MVIGIPRETHRLEHRVGMTPHGVARLVQRGHTVVVERQAGETAHFADHNYREAGGEVVYGSEEVCKRSDLICRVGSIAPDELDLLRPGQTICSFHHMAVMSRNVVERLQQLEITLVGYEIVRDQDGDLPVLAPFSEMAGQMAVHVAAQYLQTESGGRGILLGNVPGVPPPTVVVLGAGTVGTAAVRQSLASGAHVIALDNDLKRLGRLQHDTAGRVVTSMAAEERLRSYTAIADVVIGAVLVPGAKAPFLATEAMVQSMKSGSVVVDVSIDQGGCVETSRPTTLADPTFIKHGVVHYCVPNMTANIPRTASRALANAALPVVSALAEGVDGALDAYPGIASGVYLRRGKR